MKSRYFFLAAGLAFAVAAFFALRPPRNIHTVVLDAIVAAIFFYLGLVPRKPLAPPTQPSTNETGPGGGEETKS